MSYETLEEFKANTGFKLTDALLQTALDNAVTQMQAYIYVPRVFQSTQKQKRHVLTLTNIAITLARFESRVNPRIIFLADRNADRVVDKGDINAFELNQDLVETDRNANVVSFDPKYGVVVFDIDLPVDGLQTLFIEYSEAKNVNLILLPLLKELNEMLAVNFVFQKIPFNRLQSGIPSWTINGVSVNFDNGVMNAVIESNRQRIKELFNLLTPTYILRNSLQAERLPIRDFIRNIGFQRTIP